MKKILIGVVLAIGAYVVIQQYLNSSGQTLSSYTGPWKDGSYTGTTYTNQYGSVQVAAVIAGSKISTVNFIQMPFDRSHSQQLSSYAEPQLLQETIQAQNANVNVISGATLTSQDYMQSLQSALTQAK